MKKFENYIIVSDIDGTFLGKEGRMVPRNLEAIEYFKENGGSFTVATGRDYFLITRTIPNIGDICNVPVIACNGAYIYDFSQNRIVEEVFLDDTIVYPIIQDIRQKFPDSSVKISAGGFYYFEKQFRCAMYDLEAFPDRVRFQPLSTTPRGNWNKVLCDGEPDEIRQIHSFLLQYPSPHYEILLAHSRTVEIQPTHGTKGAMLPRLKQLIHKPDATLIAVGDYENDLPMLTKADRSACPANAIASVQSLPNIIHLCDHDSGAIADLIAKL
jgi:Cof subfamily protein (haloacid dehalogenase superfamily)